MRLLLLLALVATWFHASAEELPRVLIIGDSISIGYTPYVETMLAGKAVVQHNTGNAGTSGNGVFLMEAWLDPKGGKWDLIHFNFGLHDLKRMSDGKPQVDPEQYERYLRLFTERLKQTGAKLVFATTTPVPEGKVNPPRVPADVAAYNEVASRVMKEAGIPIDDLYALAVANQAEWQQPVNVHFTPGGYQGLAAQVSRVISEQLPLANSVRRNDRP
jgi:acyl-CoA thioesterase-1